MTAPADFSSSDRFRMDMNGETVFWCQEVTGLEASDGDAPPPARRLPGLRKVGSVNMRRGRTKSEELLAWTGRIREGRIDRRTITITLLNEEGREQAVWQLSNAWPIKCAVSEARNSSGEALVDLLEVAHEGMIQSR